MDWLKRNWFTILLLIAIVVLTVVFVQNGGCSVQTPPPAPTPKPTAQAAPPYVMPAPTAQVPPVAKQGVCPEVAIRTEPQGVLQSDGSFVAQLGNTGCVTLFEGRIWEQGKPIQPRHDIVRIDGAKDGFRLWEGNGWLLPANWDANQIACQLWQGKQQNWISQGITPLPVQFWNLGSLNCQAAASSPTAVASVPKPTQVSSSQPSTVAAAATDWTKVLSGVSAARLESCPGEPESRCVHIKDGDIITIGISEGFLYEGWDGRSTIKGVGPATVKASGLTVRTR